jgi:hypothetical protein
MFWFHYLYFKYRKIIVRYFIEYLQSFVKTQGLYTQHFILVVAYEWAQYARVLHYTRRAGLAKDKHSSLLGPFVSYD